MKRCLLILLVGSFAVLAPTPTSTGQTQEDRVLTIPTEAIGQDCEIVLKTLTAKSVELDAGKLVRMDSHNLVLRESTRTIKVEKQVPILSSIPFIRNWFRNTSVGVEKVPGELTISRDEIESFKIVH